MTVPELPSNVLYTDPWVTVDTIPAVTTNGVTYDHRRVISGNGYGAIIVPRAIFRGSVLLGRVTQPRPVVGLASSLEFPRGRTHDLDSAEAARELFEETGLTITPDQIRRIGTLHPDTGLLTTTVGVWCATVPYEQIAASEGREEAETGVTVRWSGLSSWGASASRHTTCAMTLATYAILEREGLLSAP